MSQTDFRLIGTLAHLIIGSLAHCPLIRSGASVTGTASVYALDERRVQIWVEPRGHSLVPYGKERVFVSRGQAGAAALAHVRKPVALNDFANIHYGKEFLWQRSMFFTMLALKT